MQRMDRSMNWDMRMGAVDGRIRFMRPDTANAETTAVVDRAAALHPQHYGSMGVANDSLGIIRAALPGAVPPEGPVRLKYDYVGYPMEWGGSGEG
jgi:hypothetical protein